MVKGEVNVLCNSVVASILLLYVMNQCLSAIQSWPVHSMPRWRLRQTSTSQCEIISLL